MYGPGQSSLRLPLHVHGIPQHLPFADSMLLCTDFPGFAEGSRPAAEQETAAGEESAVGMETAAGLQPTAGLELCDTAGASFSQQQVWKPAVCATLEQRMLRV